MICGIKFVDYAVKPGKGVNEWSYMINEEKTATSKFKPFCILHCPLSHSLQRCGLCSKTLVS